MSKVSCSRTSRAADRKEMRLAEQSFHRPFSVASHRPRMGSSQVLPGRRLARPRAILRRSSRFAQIDRYQALEALSSQALEREVFDPG
jgi:hypothetical protein